MYHTKFPGQTHGAMKNSLVQERSPGQEPPKSMTKMVFLRVARESRGFGRGTSPPPPPPGKPGTDIPLPK